MAGPKRTTPRVSRGPSGRLYGGESAPRYSPIGTRHYVNGDDYGAANRMYGQDRPKLPRPPKPKPRAAGAKKRAL